MISQRTIDEVRNLPIENIISSYVSLKKSGATIKGCCPFHDEKTPSFTVSQAKGIYKCFGCGVSGDGIKFVMEKENITFLESIELLANGNNIAIQYEDGKIPEPGAKEKKKNVLNALRAAASIYTEQLASNFPAFDYVRNRNLTPETIAHWKIGFAPNDNKFLTTRIIKNNYWEFADAAGIVNSKEGNSYDFFRNRIIIPIENANGDIISLAGRSLPGNDKDFKYLNTRNTEVYNKSLVLFGLSKARRAIKEEGFAFLTEGYLDVIKLHQFGWENTIATCGTALTRDHAIQLRRYTESVYIMRDGDKAGLKAMEKDIVILSEHFSNIKVVLIPAGHDPDSLIDNYSSQLFWDTFSEAPADAFEWLCSQWLTRAGNDIVERSEAIEKCVELLINVKSQVQREWYIANLCKIFKLKEKQFKDILKDLMMESSEQLFPEDELPKWVPVDKLYTDGFVMNYTEDKDKIGIYYKGDNKPVVRLTNYAVKPLYYVNDPNEPTRLIEVYNGYKTAVVELSNKAFTSQEVFETSIVSKGAFYSMIGFNKPQYKMLANWLTEKMPMVHPLNTLGWQPEGFFAFSNKIIDPETNTLVDYNEYGIAQMGDYTFLSPGASKINQGNRAEENNYENDMFLSYAKSPITFKQWAQLFSDVYEEHAPFAIAFILISAFKDIVTRVNKCPIPYYYGPKGSGKSAIAESMMWFFFSGKNAEGKLIQGYNLNPGQGTPFSFFSRLERFRNVFMLYNEYDPNTIEFWKKGAFKSSYDGEGREVGSGETGKKRKTKIQKTQCVPGIAGQYLDTTDDGSVMSRSVLFKFSDHKNKNRDDKQKENWKKLNDYEHQGISSLAMDLYKYRGDVQKDLKEKFWSIQSELNTQLRTKKMVIELRLLNNYSLCLALINIMENKLELPFTYKEFYQQTLTRIIDHARLLKDNNILSTFWHIIEVLFDDGFIQNKIHLLIKSESSIRVKEEGEIKSKSVLPTREILYIRMNSLHDKFAKRFRELNNKVAPDVDTLITYLKDQPYYLGLCPTVSFKETQTSAFMVDYELLQIQGINLVKHYDPEMNQPAETVKPEVSPFSSTKTTNSDLPF